MRCLSLLLASLVFASATSPALAVWDPATEWQHATRPPLTFTDYYGYAPGRSDQRDMGWLAHTNTTHHTTEFEAYPDFFRINIGSTPDAASGSGGFQRTYLRELNNYPALTGNGRIIIRARRDAHSTGEMKMMFFDKADPTISGNAFSYGIVIQSGQLKDIRNQTSTIAYPTTQWSQWHDYIFERNGTNVTVSVDNNPALTLSLTHTYSKELLGGSTQAWLTLGHQSLPHLQRFLDIQSITFQSLSDPLPSNTAGPAPAMSGQHITYWDNGQVRTKGQYLNGKPVGTFQSFFRNGQRESEGDFTDGSKQGLWRHWFQDGQARKLIEFENDLYDGTYARWRYDGTLQFSGFWNDGARTLSSYTPNHQYGDLDALLYAATQPINTNLNYGEDQIAGAILPDAFTPGTVLRFYDRQNILSATLNGQPISFDNSTFSYKSILLPTSGQLEVTFVPEPGSIAALLGFGALMVSRHTRRRTQ